MEAKEKASGGKGKTTKKKTTKKVATKNKTSPNDNRRQSAKGNKNAVGNKGGRPPFYSDPIEMEKGIEEYYRSCEGEVMKDEEGKPIINQFGKPVIINKRPLTVAGLALYLGFADKVSLFEYSKKIEFTNLIKRAITRIEQQHEERLHEDKPVGSIFFLKNHGWKDKIEQEVTIVDVTLDMSPTKSEE